MHLYKPKNVTKYRLKNSLLLILHPEQFSLPILRGRYCQGLAPYLWKHNTEALKSLFFHSFQLELNILELYFTRVKK